MDQPRTADSAPPSTSQKAMQAHSISAGAWLSPYRQLIHGIDPSVVRMLSAVAAVSPRSDT